jgi:hypothetical protein
VNDKPTLKAILDSCSAEELATMVIRHADREYVVRYVTELAGRRSERVVKRLAASHAELVRMVRKAGRK